MLIKITRPNKQITKPQTPNNPLSQGLILRCYKMVKIKTVKRQTIEVIIPKSTWINAKDKYIWTESKKIGNLEFYC